jgi:hypothetical protein
MINDADGLFSKPVNKESLGREFADKMGLLNSGGHSVTASLQELQAGKLRRAEELQRRQDTYAEHHNGQPMSQGQVVKEKLRMFVDSFFKPFQTTGHDIAASHKEGGDYGQVVDQKNNNRATERLRR